MPGTQQTMWNLAPRQRQDQNWGTLQSDLIGEGEVVGKAFPATWVHRERKLDQEVS